MCPGISSLENFNNSAPSQPDNLKTVVLSHSTASSVAQFTNIWPGWKYMPVNTRGLTPGQPRREISWFPTTPSERDRLASRELSSASVYPAVRYLTPRISTVSFSCMPMSNSKGVVHIVKHHHFRMKWQATKICFLGSPKWNGKTFPKTVSDGVYIRYL